MCDVLDEWGERDRQRRADIRSLWRAMSAAEYEVRNKKAEERREKAAPKPKRGRGKAR